MDRNSVFKEKRPLFRPKWAKVAENIDPNIDPRYACPPCMESPSV
jgi:hypothetical protein